MDSVTYWLLREQCRWCAWLRANGTCRVFRDRLAAWQTPGGRCEAHATRDQAARINAAIRAYWRRHCRGKNHAPLSFDGVAEAR